MTPADPVRRYLAAMGVRADLVEAGLEGLVARWEQIVEHVARGYDLTPDDYRNDMDIRGLIEGAIDTIGPDAPAVLTARLEAADDRLRSVTSASASIGHADDLLDDEAHWWYFRRPRNAGPAFEE